MSLLTPVGGMCLPQPRVLSSILGVTALSAPITNGTTLFSLYYLYFHSLYSQEVRKNKLIKKKKKI